MKFVAETHPDTCHMTKISNLKKSKMAAISKVIKGKRIKLLLLITNPKVNCHTPTGYRRGAHLPF